MRSHNGSNDTTLDPPLLWLYNTFKAQRFMHAINNRYSHHWISSTHVQNSNQPLKETVKQDLSSLSLIRLAPLKIWLDLDFGFNPHKYEN
jgi:hypothetical protein